MKEWKGYIKQPVSICIWPLKSCTEMTRKVSVFTIRIFLDKIDRRLLEIVGNYSDTPCSDCNSVDKGLWTSFVSFICYFVDQGTIINKIKLYVLCSRFLILNIWPIRALINYYADQCQLFNSFQIISAALDIWWIYQDCSAISLIHPGLSDALQLANLGAHLSFPSPPFFWL